MEYAEILHRCFRCGYCKLPGSYEDLNCPSYLKSRFETFSPGGRMWLLWAWLNGDINTSQRLSQILFSCASCANCVEHCVFPKFKDDLLNAFISGREELVNEGIVPPKVRDYLKAMNVHGNPYKLPQADRGKWAEGLDLEPYEGQEHLLFIGCVGAYDERGQKIARAVASLLKDWQVSFGILGSEEHCDGNEVKCLGERGLFGQMAQENIRAFQEASVKNIITLSPHAFHALKEEYPKLGGDFQVYHYSQILGRLISKIDFKVKQRTLRVTYHDPCYLGRHQKEYKAPRRVLRALRGVQFTEMGRAEANALCCGGGGGNFFTDVLGTGPDSPARVRVREALETGAEIIAVACPNCAKMLEDAVKAEFLEDNLAVMDLAELVQLP
ncbi:MAG: (Fe-S)-binding protein [Desulfobacteraceae bacterium]